MIAINARVHLFALCVHFCAMVVPYDDIRKHGYFFTPGRYVVAKAVVDS